MKRMTNPQSGGRKGINDEKKKRQGRYRKDSLIYSTLLAIDKEDEKYIFIEIVSFISVGKVRVPSMKRRYTNRMNRITRN